ncbi:MULTISPECIES: fumarylacetoacetate hydrolase family protein [Paraburkholderia]|uniref:Fumarylacetoacetate hydrolase family protein n=1 Tax=Paraburkholderia madseniana TaxID=2599607 RepID=A0AAP5BAW1_9BURK|nr:MULTISPECIES: fumarylacetoacetate hydrolase family protein [Paraburkholderia]MCX4145270.1 fumarylacetoacetate hydrolase family protein [Paraburkholderia madseniana]MDN7148220.1 fumarylacetoacetate hydrolase family protein [Paraburkholderia sp. WS6]MDQ6407100.1 fumarylacetoacetate hydrolase family protein [Paraburkholderia madseniana]
MALHVLHYLHHGHAQWGVVANGAITPIPGEFRSTAEFIEANPIERLFLPRGLTIPESEVQWLSPVTANQQFICQGANYRQHMIESGMDPDVKKFNMIFTKATSCIVPADSPVVKPNGVQFLDYEIELGLVLKRDITSRESVTEENLHDYIAGAVIVNDYSARDIQIPQMQFYKGKSYRTFGPVGPYLCLLEKQDIPKLKELVLTLTVNGTVRQNDSTAGLVYGPVETLTELSAVHDLHAGDLLATGTPSGCALSIPSPEKQRAAAQLPEAEKWRLFLKMQEDRPQYLRAGDLVEAHIVSCDGAINLGVQRNVVVDEAA